MRTVNVRQGFVDCWHHLAKDVVTCNRRHGFHKQKPNDGEDIALMHSELSEALEALRHGDPQDDKVPAFRGSEAELADLVIRVMQYAARRGLRVPEALLAKMDYNEGRPFKHGGKRF